MPAHSSLCSGRCVNSPMSQWCHRGLDVAASGGPRTSRRQSSPRSSGSSGVAASGCSRSRHLAAPDRDHPAGTRADGRGAARDAADERPAGTTQAARRGVLEARRARAAARGRAAARPAAAPKARRELTSTRRPRMLLPAPPITAPMPNGSALPSHDAPPRAANWWMNDFLSRSTSGPTAARGSVLVTSSPQYLSRVGPAPGRLPGELRDEVDALLAEHERQHERARAIGIRDGDAVHLGDGLREERGRLEECRPSRRRSARGSRRCRCRGRRPWRRRRRRRVVTAAR